MFAATQTRGNYLGGLKNEMQVLWKFHLNQSLVLHIASIAVSMIPKVGSALSAVVFVFWILGFISACQGEMKNLPVISDIQLIK